MQHGARGALCLFGIGLTLGGCQHVINDWEAQSRVDPRTVVSYPNAVERDPNDRTAARSTCAAARLRGDYHLIPINLDCFSFPEDVPPAAPVGANGQQTVSRPAYDRAVTDSLSRNRLAAILLKQSDDICTKEMADVSARESMFNTSLGILTSTLSSVASIVTGERAKSWFAGGATLTNASRDHINSEIFRNVLASAIAKAIENSREVQLGKINTNLAKNNKDYTVDYMIRDVNKYHQTCSFYYGLVLVVDAVNRASPNTANAYRELTAGINDLTKDIDELEAKIASKETSSELKDKLKQEYEALVDQREKLRVKRSELSTAATPAEPPKEPKPAAAASPQ